MYFIDDLECKVFVFYVLGNSYQDICVYIVDFYGIEFFNGIFNVVIDKLLLEFEVW